MSSGGPQVPPAARGHTACSGGVVGALPGPHPGRIALRVCSVCSQHLDPRGEPGRLLTWWGQHRGSAARVSSSLPAPAGRDLAGGHPASQTPLAIGLAVVPAPLPRCHSVCDCMAAARVPDRPQQPTMVTCHSCYLLLSGVWDKNPEMDRRGSRALPAFWLQRRPPQGCIPSTPTPGPQGCQAWSPH